MRTRLTASSENSLFALRTSSWASTNLYTILEVRCTVCIGLDSLDNPLFTLS